MRAARIYKHGGPEVFTVENDVPEPVPGANDLLIRQVRTSANHRDVWIRKGLSDDTFQIELPAVLGVDFSGEVVEVGKNVTEFAVGDRIVANPQFACGHCHACRGQRPQFCMNVDIANGSYAQYAKVAEGQAIRLDDSVSADAAACFANTYITAWEMLINRAKITPEDTVFIWAGTSGVGSAAVDIAKLVNARIITTAGHPHKLDILKKRTSGLVLDHYNDDIVNEVLEATDGVGATVVVEHTGAATWERSMLLASAGARIVNAGLTTGQTLKTDAVIMIIKQLTIMGYSLGTMSGAKAAVSFLNKGSLSPLIGEKLPLSRISEAHEMLESGKVAGKILLNLDE
ncbi:MAG TPA: alcohol dehydrogenase catalytic domain-containing protein [Pusillimonas sp.]|uniref:alcohol dehydrogenase catalytic domain-containing protein n=1 Tax=Pusillimonas sp. TaxID=3040095 RepID=UPI002B7CAEB8|nr:alcohol dehydrogenase catalytic domain-containing protein [Pusillimonas sp.]HUH86603.1 alcohol dehydrogenase catalytic domain-containing protein [Pusillimonas sp.]